MPKKATRPEWAERLEHFRKELGWSQAALARKLHVSPMATSRWERGVNQPTAAIYIRLGKLARDSDRWYFWERAGLSQRDLQADGRPRSRAKLEVSGGAPGMARPEIAKASISKLVAVPFYSRLSPEFRPEESERPEQKPSDFVVVPREWVPQPDSTICLRIEDDRMYPLMQSGTTYGVDLQVKDPKAVDGKLVLAWHESKGVVARWLQRYGNAWVLLPENRSYSPDYLSAGWKVAGRVLWWFSKSS